MGDWTDNAWYMPGYDDTSWQQAKSLHRPPRAPFNALSQSEIPILNNYGLAYCENYPASKFPFVSNGETIKCVLDFNKNVTPYFDIEAEQGQTVHIDSNMRLNTIETEYTTKEGRQQFESYSWFNARTIEYSFPKGVTVHGLKYRWTGVGSTPGHLASRYQRTVIQCILNNVIIYGVLWSPVCPFPRATSKRGEAAFTGSP